ncbi:MAG: transporter [Flavobacteriaceae bacterium]|nr:transporter [Flavobacteriaceae bacterium]
MIKSAQNILILALFAFPFLISAQYTEVINSNRPGLSVSAYAVGKGVIQAELGLLYEQQDHSLLQTESDILGADLALRYGFLFENLELIYEGTFVKQDRIFLPFNTEDSRTDFLRNRLGFKYLLFDPFKDPDKNKPNLYSWRANNVFQLKNLIPAISVYGGVNYLFGDNPFYAGDPELSYRAMVATQSKVNSRLVLITNIAYDRISTDDPELSYTVSLSHALANPRWSVFIENQGIKSDRYADQLLRGGVAHLFSENFQADLYLGASFKNTPSRIFGGLGMSYRIDGHKDEVKAIEDQDAGQNGGLIKRNAMKGKGRKKGKKGSGAEDIDLGPTKKQLRQLKKKQKKAKKDEIDF